MAKYGKDTVCLKLFFTRSYTLGQVTSLSDCLQRTQQLSSQKGSLVGEKLPHALKPKNKLGVAYHFQTALLEGETSRDHKIIHTLGQIASRSDVQTRK